MVPGDRCFSGPTGSNEILITQTLPGFGSGLKYPEICTLFKEIIIPACPLQAERFPLSCESEENVS
jgi:hypothetical protein